MKHAFLFSLLITTFVFGTTKYPEFVWSFDYEIGDAKTEVISSALNESEFFVFDDMLYFTRYLFTREPIGVICSRYRVIFDSDTVAYLEQSLGGWTDIYKSQLPERKESAVASANQSWDAVTKAYESTVITETDSTKIVVLKNREHSIRANLYTKNDFQGLFRIYEDSSFSTVQTPSRSEQWFGLGEIVEDSVIKVKETNSIPHSETTRYLWVVNTNFDTETELFLTAKFPAPLDESQLPAGVEYDRSNNSVKMPMGTFKEEFVSGFGIDNNDPEGVYTATLSTEDEIIAAVSYSISKPEDK